MAISPLKLRWFSALQDLQDIRPDLPKLLSVHQKWGCRLAYPSQVALVKQASDQRRPIDRQCADRDIRWKCKGVPGLSRLLRLPLTQQKRLDLTFVFGQWTVLTENPRHTH